MKPVMRELIERLLGPRGIMRLRRFARGQERPRWGNLRRRPVKAFACPNGQPGDDYTPETVKLVEELGFDFAFTSRHGFASSSEPPLERSRLLMLSGISAAELAHRLCYSWRR